MKLHENPSLFKQAIAFTAQQMGIVDIYVEKDYWVTLALHTIFQDEIGKETIFKGGTALSKCFGMIERFSEDIDLVVLQGNGESGNLLKKKLKKITDIVATELEEIEVDGITHKMGIIRKTAHNYSKQFTGEFGQVRDVIVVEATWLGKYEPYHKQNIHSYIFDMMQNTNQMELAKEYGLLPFEVQVLGLTRTICEKIMSLVRFSYGEHAIENLQNKVRHTYDIHQLLQNEDVKTFFESPSFDEMLLKVAQDDVESFKTGISWLTNHPNEALLFREVETTWKLIKSTYNNQFKNLVYGEFPKDTAILETLLMLKNRMIAIKWRIKLK